MTGDVLILSGPPAAGKTTVARLLASSAPKPTVHLETDQFFRAIRTGFVLPYLPEAEPQNKVVLTAVVDAVAAFTSGGYDVIVEGIIGPWFLPRFSPLAALRIDYVVLLPSLEATLARADTRAASHLRDPGPITGLHGAFPRDAHTIDTTGQEPSLTASHVREGLASTRFRLPAPQLSAEVAE
ncbi:AAA family ATPase [Actinoplanes sp. NPDC051411]|uniref:phosphotransferase-like protein n=1 Tax=Actinoplanes sp. NPDC051411 TaxID=3155522 RepID=UPI0034190AF0